MKAYFICILSCLLLILSSCKKDKVPGDYTIRNMNCKEQAFSGKNIKICFDSLITDQRCPIDIDCITSGYAIVVFRISIDEISTTVQLSPNGFTLNSMVKSDTSFGGYKFQFMELNPLPSLSNPVDVNDYFVIIKITDL